MFIIVTKIMDCTKCDQLADLTIHLQTKNDWDNRGSFVKYKGKYGLIETDENDDDDGDGTGDASLGKLSEDQIQKACSCDYI